MNDKKDTFLETLKEDTSYLKFKNIVQMVQGALDPDKIQIEAMTLHKTRPSRNMFENKTSPNKLFDAIMKDLSCRARLVELRTNLFIQQEILITALDAMKDHLLTKYGDNIKDRTNNAEERNAFIRRLLSRGVNIKNKFASVLVVLDKFIEDIDKSGYAMTNAKDLLKIMIERPGQSV